MINRKHTVPLSFRIKMIEMAVADYNRALLDRTWIENDEDGFTGYRWDKTNSRRIVVCAANRYKDFIVAGVRHQCVNMVAIQTLVGRDALMEYCQGDKEQGFLDQYGIFLTRKEAMELVKTNGQTLHGRDPSDWQQNKLFSEDLY